MRKKRHSQLVPTKQEMKVHNLLSDNIDTENVNFEPGPALIEEQGRQPSEIPSSLSYPWASVILCHLFP